MTLPRLYPQRDRPQQRHVALIRVLLILVMLKPQPRIWNLLPQAHRIRCDGHPLARWVVTGRDGQLVVHGQIQQGSTNAPNPLIPPAGARP